jgi:hypothetical protein
MSRTKQTSKRKRRSKAVPIAAGLSLALASEASIATPAPSLDMMTRTAREHHEIVLYEEEIFDLSLATFRVFDNEKVGACRAGKQHIAFGGGACCQFACLGGQSPSGFEGSSARNDAYSPPPRRPTRKGVRRKP